ncbi:SDR family NAD(P)-dependent oxidoreductase [Paenibacillus sp. Dod16]|uniref:SDR family NAD(P)-dependent oxidoreductase n=1 Tax=Paenibacillus sp. Dod16 TaxID=3416392 RepID=UPI003CF20A72
MIQYGVQAYALACDLSKANAPRQLAEQISELGLSVDILINNAGVGTYGLRGNSPGARAGGLR